MARLLASEPGLEIAGECGSAAEALEVLGASPVNVVLLDFDHATDGADGFMSAARRKGFQGRFLVLAGTLDARASAVAIKLGVSGVFLKSETPDRLVHAITLVANGAVWLDQRIIRLLADQSVDRFPQPAEQGSPNLLTERERKVLLGILGGLSNKNIADKLGVSEGAVKTSVQQLFHKAGVRSRSRLVRAALEGSLVTAAESVRRAQNAAAAGLGPTPV